ncbi:MAG: alpha/beta hydrolase [Haloplanus sp.]
MSESDPHADAERLTAGASLDDASTAAILLHGRGASAESVVALTEEFPEDVAYVAPQAARNTWYPNSFMADVESNEPWLSSALRAVGGVLADVNDAGIPTDRTLLLGFSQGACLASEFVARNATAYGGLAALSGGLVGPPGTPREYDGSLDGTPAFVGCSDVDPHIPLERVHETTEVLEALGAEVTERIYEGMGHGINEDEIASVADMLGEL